MTLEHAFPGLAGSPGGAVLALADNLFDLTGPANAMMIEVLQNKARQLRSEISAIDPKWHYNEEGNKDMFGNPILTVQSVNTTVDNLRFQRAAVFLKVKGDARPLQLETLRFIQDRADDAYDQGMARLKTGRLKLRLSEREALGNYIDTNVRIDLRARYD